MVVSSFLILEQPIVNTTVVGRIIEIFEHKHVAVLQIQARRLPWQSPVTREVYMPVELWPSVLIAAQSPDSMLIVTGYAQHAPMAQADWIIATQVTIVIEDQLQFPSHV
jgi:hypothetical protein